MTNNKLLPAIQADRDEAAAYMKLIRDTRWSIEGILSGGCDNTSIVQAFARHRLRQGNVSRKSLEAAIRAANLALFVIRKQSMMPNSSWQGGFEKDLALAEAGLAATEPKEVI